MMDDYLHSCAWVDTPPTKPTYFPATQNLHLHTSLVLWPLSLSGTRPFTAQNLPGTGIDLHHTRNTCRFLFLFLFSSISFLWDNT
jgi:hypothetical protein